MAETEWPQPVFRSSIAKVPPRVPKFGTWQAEVEEDPGETPSNDVLPEPQCVRLGKKSQHPLEKFQILGPRRHSSNHSSSEDVAVLVASRSGSGPRVQKGFTREFNIARRAKAGVDPARAEGGGGTSPPRGASRLGPTHPGVPGEKVPLSKEERRRRKEERAHQVDLELEEELWGPCAQDMSGPVQGSPAFAAHRGALFRCPSEPPKPGRGAWKKGGGVRSGLGMAVSRLGLGMGEGGRTSSTGVIKIKSQGLKGGPSESCWALDSEEEAGAGDSKESEQGMASAKATPVFGTWAQGPSERPLSPLSSYSSVFEDMREERKRRSAGEVLERLKQAQAAKGTEQQEAKESEVSSPEACRTLLETTSDSSSGGGESLNSGDAGDSAEAAWLRRRMELKQGLEGGGQSHQGTPSRAVERAAKEMKGAMKRTCSESVATAHRSEKTGLLEAELASRQNRGPPRPGPVRRTEGPPVPKAASGKAMRRCASEAQPKGVGTMHRKTASLSVAKSCKKVLRDPRERTSKGKDAHVPSNPVAARDARRALQRNRSALKKQQSQTAMGTEHSTQTHVQHSSPSLSSCGHGTPSRDDVSDGKSRKGHCSGESGKTASRESPRTLPSPSKSWTAGEEFKAAGQHSAGFKLSVPSSFRAWFTFTRKSEAARSIQK